MPVPLAFRAPAGWQAFFTSRGLRLRETRWPGAWWERLVHHPLLFVLDVPAGRETAQRAIGTAAGTSSR